VPRPGSIYGATKAFAEHLATALATEHPQAVIVGLRYGWVYGPGRERGWRDIQAVIEAAAAGDSPVRFPDVEEPIDWTWVEDAAAVTTRAVVAPITPGHTVLNVAGDKRRVREAIDVLRRLSPATRFEAVPTTTPPTAWAFANDRLERLLGVAPHTPMEEGVRRLWDRARAGTAE
jgi:UDP-glucose 4-epimerase